MAENSSAYKVVGILNKSLDRIAVRKLMWKKISAPATGDLT
jgi:hypothetical protein